LILLILPIGVLLARQNETPDPANTLKVVTYNIDNIKDNQRLLEVCATIRGIGIPDVLLMQEVHGKYAASFLAENLGMPYFRYTDYARYQAGLAILSQKPLDNVKIHYFKDSRHGYGALAAEISITDQRLLICSLHLDRIPQVPIRGRVSGFTTLRVFKKEIFNDTVRSRSVEELIEWVSGFKTDYIILGGDFNTFPLSKPIRRMTDKFNDALWPTMGYFTGTYNELDYPFKPLNPRIDFLFHSPCIKRLRAEVVKTGPSDHYPVKAVFGVEG